ncbi:hypothetical protein CsSME_00045735 [Camellia sinensis var. sinensis]
MGSSLSKKTIICSSPNALPDPLPNQTKTHTNLQLTDTKKPEEEPLLFIVVVFVEIDSPLLIITSRKGSRFQLSPLLIITTRKDWCCNGVMVDTSHGQRLEAWGKMGPEWVQIQVQNLPG